jgi:hypothetical protein
MQLNGSFTLAKSVKQNHWQPRQVTVTTVLALATLGGATIDIESLQNRLLKVCYVPAASASLPRVSFFFSFLFFVAAAIDSTNGANKVT